MVLLFCESRVRKGAMGRETGWDDWQSGDRVGEAHVEAMDGETFFQKAWIWKDRKRKEIPEKVSKGFLCWLSFLSLFKEERNYRLETGEEVRKSGEDNWWMEIFEDQEWYQVYLRQRKIPLLLDRRKKSQVGLQLILITEGGGACSEWSVLKASYRGTGWRGGLSRNTQDCWIELKMQLSWEINL